MHTRLLSCLLFSVFIRAAHSQAFDFEDYAEAPVEWELVAKPAPSAEEQLVDFARRYLGTPYRYAGKTPAGFDCSGFAGFVFKEFGVALPASSAEIARIGEAVERQDLSVGDLVFFEGRERTQTVGHVGIVSEVTGSDVYFIHAAVWSGGIIISGLKEEYYASRYLKAKRVKIN